LTRLAAVIGHPVRHSLSPAILNRAFRELDLDWTYVAFDVAPGEAQRALEAMKTLGIEGYSVTMPHKTDVARAVDRLTAEARVLEAVNCVSRDGRLLIGHNTDGEGFVRALREEVAGFDPAGARCVVFGAGGAARAIIAALGRAGAAEVVVVNRTPERGARAALVAGDCGRSGEASAVRTADLVVNATSVGMANGDPAAGTGGGSVPSGRGRGSAVGGDVPFDTSLVRPGQIVADIVYQPLRTTLLEQSAAAGATVVGGLGMLVHQAAIAFEIWTGQAAPVAAMREAALAQLRARDDDPY
jgi:shikimate dehydrogenase